MDHIQDLSAEVQRIVAAPYNVSLQKLHTILARVQPYEITSWARGRCDMYALSTVVVANLQSGPWTLAIIQKLAAGSVPFRDAVLELEPLLLDHLLHKAAGSEEAYEKYASVCVALLSSPLNIAIPAAFPGFLDKILARAVAKPSAETIRPVHSILSGSGCSELLAASQSLVVRLQEQLKTILNGRRDTEDESPTIFCLAVFAILASTQSLAFEVRQGPLVMGQSGTCDEGRHDRLEIARKFIGPHRASKTLDLTVASARRLCSKSCIESPNSIIERLNLCREIVASVADIDKQKWCTSRIAMSKVPIDGILRSDLDSRVRSAAIEFACALYGDGAFPRELYPAVKRVVQESKHRPSKKLSVIYIDGMDEDHLSSVLLRMMRLITQPECPSSRALTDVEMATDLAIELAAKSTTCQGLRQKVLHLLSSKEFVASLHHFAATLPLDPDRGKLQADGICSMRFKDSLRKLQQRLCFLLLQTGLQFSDNAVRIDSRHITALLEMQMTLSCSSAGCTCVPTSKALRPISLFETQSTQGMPSREWEDRLKDRLSSDAEFQRHTIAKIVDEVCRDLQARCDDAERPYREELDRSRNLGQKIKALDDLVAELRRQNEDYSHSINEFASEKLHITQRAEAAELRSQAGADEIKNLRKKLEFAESEAIRIRKEFSEAARQQDLLYMATVTGKDEELDEKALRINTLDDKVDVLDRDLSRSVSRVQHLEASLSQRSQELTQATDLIAEKQTEMESLSHAKSSLDIDNESLRSRVDDLLHQNHAARTALDSQAEAFKLEKLKIEAARAEFESVKANEIDDLRRSHQDSMLLLQAEYEQKTDGIIKQGKEKAFNQKQKIQKLQHDLEQRNKQMIEAQERQKQVLRCMQADFITVPTVMSLPIDHNEPRSPSFIGSPPYTRQSSSKTSNSFESPKSSRSGPSPKRARMTSRRGFKTPMSTHTKLSATNIFTHHPLRSSKPRYGRQALVDLGSASANRHVVDAKEPEDKTLQRRHTSIPMPMNGKNEVSAGRMLLDEISFNESDIFTSTTKERLGAPYTDEENDVYHDDGTTVDV